jgi:hypothetical protein
VKTKLFDDNILRGVGIRVDTFRGYVTLKGAVDNETQRERATAIVKSVYGVRKANNLLADRMFTDDDWKDEEKESTVLVILFPTCCNSLLPDFLRGS